MTSYLVTGGAGFIGSNFIRRTLETDPQATVINLDLLTYAGVRATVDDLDHRDRHSFVHGDIRDAALVDGLMSDVDVVVNFAAETHVDRSISGPSAFLETNVVGTGVLLDAARRHDVPRYVQVSTDEVYGSLASGAAVETDRLVPSSPYSASKAAADLLVASYAVTYGYDAIVTRCTNNYGPFQFPEKLIPLFITRLMAGETVPVYGDGRHVREWLHVDDHCSALATIIARGAPGEVYNIGSGSHVTNLDVVATLVELVGADPSLVTRVADRPGHDRRYAVDSRRVRALGWEPAHSFREGLEETVAWYTANEAWWRPLRPAR